MKATETRATSKVNTAEQEPELTLEQKVSRYVKVATANELLAATYNKQIEALRSKYEKKFNAQKEECQKLHDSIKAECIAKRKSLFKDGKSITICGATISFRAGTPALDVLKGITWDQALEKVKQLAKKYIISKPQMDKNALKKLNDTDKGKELLKQCGLTVKTEESFSITVKEN